MAKKDKSRPIYGSSQGGIPAEAMRLLAPEEAERSMPVSPWWRKIPDWFRGTLGIKEIPKGSGFGYIYPPYYSTYNLVYGLLPIADLPKYRVLYRSMPDLKAGVDLIVNLATAKGFTIEYGHEDARKLLEDIIDKIDLEFHLQVVCRDMMIAGNAYMEIMWDEAEEIQDEVELGKDLVSFIHKEFPLLERGLKDKNMPETSFIAIKELQPIVGAWKKAISGKKIYSKNGGYYCKATRMMRGKSKNIVGVKMLDPCLLPGTNILLRNSIKPVEDVSLGELTITHTGQYKPISQLHKRQLQEDNEIASFKISKFSEPFNVTLHHPILTIQKYDWDKYLYRLKNQRKEERKYNLNKRKTKPHNNIKTPSPKWIEAGALKAGDITLYALNKNIGTGTLKTIELNKWVTPLKRIHKNYHDIYKLKISIDDELCELIGWYLAEGSTNNGNIQFSLSKDEESVAKKLLVIIEQKFGIKGKYKFGDKSDIYCYVCSIQLKELFEKICGKGSNNKELLPDFLEGLSLSQLKTIVESWRNGDGCTHIYGKKTVGNKAGSNSLTLIHQMKDVLLCLGYVPHLKKDKESIFSHKTNGIKTKPFYVLTWYEHGNRSFSKVDNDFAYIRVKSVKRLPYKNGIIYNLTIENDASYNLEYVTTHNTYMRVKADAFANIYGYIQWLVFPPAVIDTDSLIHFKNAPTSEAYQTVYGQSQFLPLIRNTDLLNLFDQDVANWIHNQAVLPLWVKAGATPDKPYSTEQIKQLITDWSGRTSATTIFTKSDIEIEVLRGGGRDLRVDWWQKYLLERRMMALGVPPVFLGQTEGVNKAISEVMLSDFVTRVQAIQTTIADLTTNQLFVPIVVANFGEDIIKEFGEPKIIWKPIIEEDRNERLMRVDRYAVDGIISVNEARQAAGWQPFRRPDHEDFDPDYDIPKLLRVPPQLGKFGMPEKPTKPLTPSGEKPRDEGEAAPPGEGKEPTKPKGKIPSQQQQKPTPKEAIKLRAFEISTDLFQKELEEILNEVDFELKAGILIKDIREKYNKIANNKISKWVAESSIKEQEKNKLKTQYLNDFIKIIEDRFEEVG